MPTLPQILEMLDADDALELTPPADRWPQLDPEDVVYELDWARLFPARATDRGQFDWEVYGNDDWQLPAEFIERLGSQGDSLATPPGWDRCAWYQPIHFFGPAWGIYVYDDCIVETARVIHQEMGLPPLNETLAKALLRAGFAVLFLHEQYHHKTESLALRLHVVEQRPTYVPYFRGVFMPAAGTDDQIEEGLANADSYHRLDEALYARWLGPTIRQLTKAYLRASFTVSPPGYRLAQHLLALTDFDSLENQLEAQVQEASLTPSRSRHGDFSIATNLNKSLFNVRQDIWSVAAKGARPLLPVKPTWVAPLSRPAVEKVLQSAGYQRVRGRGKGSHYVYAKDGCPMVVLPDSRDLSHVVLRNTAHALGMKNARELVEATRG